MHALTVDQIARTVTGHLTLVASAIDDVQVIVINISVGTALLVPLAALIAVQGLAPHHLARLEVDEQTLILGIVGHRQRLIGIWERGHCRYALRFGQAGPFVEPFKSKQQFLLACCGINGPAGIGPV